MLRYRTFRRFCASIDAFDARHAAANAAMPFEMREAAIELPHLCAYALRHVAAYAISPLALPRWRFARHTLYGIRF